MKSRSLTFATQMLFRRSGSELFDTFKNIILFRIFPLWNIYSWKMLRKLNNKFQENLSHLGIIDARTRYRAVARRLRNTALHDTCHRLPRDLGFESPHNPEVLTRGWIYGRHFLSNVHGQLFKWPIYCSVAQHRGLSEEVRRLWRLWCCVHCVRISRCLSGTISSVRVTHTS